MLLHRRVVNYDGDFLRVGLYFSPPLPSRRWPPRRESLPRRSFRAKNIALLVENTIVIPSLAGVVPPELHQNSEETIHDAGSRLCEMD